MALVGIDLVETARIKKSIEKGAFLSKILGEQEYLQLKERNFPVQSVGVCFCAKEAFSKAIGTGIGKVGFKEIQLLREENGRPFLKLSGNALKIASEMGYQFSVSATHTKDYVSVVVIGDKNGENF